MWRWKYEGGKSSVIYKKKETVLKVIAILDCGVCPVDGAGLGPCHVFLVKEFVSVFWLMELDLLSLKGSAVSSCRFWSIYGFSMPLGSHSSFCGVQFSSVAQSCPTLRPHQSQHTRPPCPSPSPGVHSDSRPSSPWCHPAISSSVIPFSSCPQSLPASESFPMSQLFSWGGQSTGVSVLASFLPKNTQGWLLQNGLVGSPCSPRDSQESYPTLQFKRINSSALSLLHSPTLTSIHDQRKNHSLD